MAIRLRNSNGLMIALCAAETDAAQGDHYIDDAEHYALAAKFTQDWLERPAGIKYPEEWSEMAKHKIRDAVESLNEWLETPMQNNPVGEELVEAFARVMVRTQSNYWEQ